MDHPTLKDIQKPIKEELSQFESYFKQSLKSKVALLDKIMYYIVQRKGKQVRPMFVFLSAKILGDTSEVTNVAAAMIELLHTATLVHDDVVDDSFERRGFFSINALWKNKIAVLVGDYLLSQGLLIAVKNKQFKLLEILTDAVREMSEGELLQIEKARKLDIKESVYFDIIRQKTASLIAASCGVGAASVTDNEENIQLMRQFGEYVGIAFQIKDDLLDYGEAKIGKPTGIDIKEKKMTLPLIFALQQTDKATKSKIIGLIKSKNEDPQAIAQVLDFVRGSGGLQYAQTTKESYILQANEVLDLLPSGAAMDSMRHLVSYVTRRDK